MIQIWNWFWNQRVKMFWLTVIVIVTYPLGWSCYPHYWKWDLYSYGWSHWQDQSRHIVGYLVLGFFYGPITLFFAVMDELLQFIVPGKQGNWFQMFLNVVSVLAAMGINQFVKVKFVNPWSKEYD